MVAEGEGRKDARPTGCRAGGATTGSCTSPRSTRTVARVDVRPGDMVEVEVTYAAPHHLVADGPVRGRTTDPLR